MGRNPDRHHQNVKDLLASKEVENIFENSDFIYMLNQAVGDRQILAKKLNISPHQLSYVTHSGEGEGLFILWKCDPSIRGQIPGKYGTLPYHDNQTVRKWLMQRRNSQRRAVSLERIEHE